MNTYPENPGSVAQAIGRYFYQPLDKLTSFFERLLMVICSTAILVAMVITTIDVVLRYGVGKPFGWSFDFVMLYLLPAAYYMAFSYAMKDGSHLSVDFFVNKVPAITLRTVYPIILLIAAVLFFYIAYLVGSEGYSSFMAGETLFGAIAWWTWPTDAIISLSFVVFAVRLILSACHHAFLKG
ncbi:TRAP transporter small permease [Alloalcanivorax xenomutans]|uniref:TRAP transporter small permease protein n=1 Tax=Alloalcanivorax xenomutans TaxID=1094342 RepID=A0A9Q3ZEH9_9GAMM|nr:TRAP transporter small permease [Alloalcanivorax xenomutans]MCE7510808.1 TRAP transporter small permease [Alloalcanivorax xenomutans]MCE7525323.1 TRAP transporter small permease [Alloalcanivorax xenomutans]